jgi:signal peptidase II
LPRLLVAAAMALGALLLDVETKRWAAGELRRTGARPLFGGAVTLMFRENSGAAFGLGRGLDRSVRRPVLVAYSAGLAAALTGLLAWRLGRRRGRLDAANLGLVALLGGTLGNLKDRVERGLVIDFVDFTPDGPIDWPAFNRADVWIAVGIGLCLTGLVAWMRRGPGAAAPAAGTR